MISFEKIHNVLAKLKLSLGATMECPDLSPTENFVNSILNTWSRSKIDFTLGQLITGSIHSIRTDYKINNNRELYVDVNNASDLNECLELSNAKSLQLIKLGTSLLLRRPIIIINFNHDYDYEIGLVHHKILVGHEEVFNSPPLIIVSLWHSIFLPTNPSLPGSLSNLSRPPSQSNSALMTLNINGIKFKGAADRSKGQLLKNIIESNNINIVLLQETHIQNICINIDTDSSTSYSYNSLLKTFKDKFDVFENSPTVIAKGTLGMLALIDPLYSASQINNFRCPFNIQEFKLNSQDISFYAINIYIPCLSSEPSLRSLTITEMVRILRLHKDNNTEVIMAGDFNMEENTLQEYLSSNNLAFTYRILQSESLYTSTFHRGSSTSKIDFIIGSKIFHGLRAEIAKQTPGLDISDHSPVKSYLHNISTPSIRFDNHMETKRPILNRQTINANKSLISNHQKWATFNERAISSSLCTPTRMVHQLLKAAKSICIELSSNNRKRKDMKSSHLSSENNNSTRKQTFSNPNQTSDPLVKIDLDAEFEGTRNNQLLSDLFFENRHSEMHENQAANYGSNRRSRNEILSITQDPNNDKGFTSDPIEVSRIMAKYGQDLFGIDITAAQPSEVFNESINNKTCKFFRKNTCRDGNTCKFAHSNHFLFNGPIDGESACTNAADPLPGNGENLRNANLDNAISFSELQYALSKLKLRKAYGTDEIPGEFWRTALGKDESLLSTALLLTFNSILDHNEVLPDSFYTGLLVFIPKKDADPKYLDNRRTLTVIITLRKLLNSIICYRLRNHLLTYNYFMKNQAGFLPGRSCEGTTFVCFMTLVRRLFDNLDTFVGFIDLRKAFDSVSHPLLIEKLKQILGSGNKILKYITNLLLNLKGQCGDEFFRIRIGVPQGDPLSPLLFIIFVNDILNGMPDITLATRVRKYLAGLLYADDTTLFSDSKQGLQELLNILEKWLDSNGLQANIKKSSIMEVSCETNNCYAASNTEINADIIAAAPPTICYLCKTNDVSHLIPHPYVTYDDIGNQIFLCPLCLTKWHKSRDDIIIKNLLLSSTHGNEDICALCAYPCSLLVDCSTCTRAYCHECLKSNNNISSLNTSWICYACLYDSHIPSQKHSLKPRRDKDISQQDPVCICCNKPSESDDTLLLKHPYLSKDLDNITIMICYQCYILWHKYRIAAMNTLDALHIISSRNEEICAICSASQGNVDDSNPSPLELYMCDRCTRAFCTACMHNGTASNYRLCSLSDLHSTNHYVCFTCIRYPKTFTTVLPVPTNRVPIVDPTTVAMASTIINANEDIHIPDINCDFLTSNWDKFLNKLHNFTKTRPSRKIYSMDTLIGTDYEEAFLIEEKGNTNDVQKLFAVNAKLKKALSSSREDACDLMIRSPNAGKSGTYTIKGQRINCELSSTMLGSFFPNISIISPKAAIQLSLDRRLTYARRKAASLHSLLTDPCGIIRLKTSRYYEIIDTATYGIGNCGIWLLKLIKDLDCIKNMPRNELILLKKTLDMIEGKLFTADLLRLELNTLCCIFGVSTTNIDFKGPDLQPNIRCTSVAAMLSELGVFPIIVVATMKVIRLAIMSIKHELVIEEINYPLPNSANNAEESLSLRRYIEIIFKQEFDNHQKDTEAYESNERADSIDPKKNTTPPSAGSLLRKIKNRIDKEYLTSKILNKKLAYFEKGFQSTCNHTKLSLYFGKFARQINTLCQARLGIFEGSLTSYMYRRGLISREKSHCLLCDMADSETLEHFVFECLGTAHLRTNIQLQNLIELASHKAVQYCLSEAIENTDAEKLACNLLLGGSTPDAKCIEGWAAIPSVLKRFHKNKEACYINLEKILPPSIIMACFLYDITKLRKPNLAKLKYETRKHHHEDYMYGKMSKQYLTTSFFPCVICNSFSNSTNTTSPCCCSDLNISYSHNSPLEDNNACDRKDHPLVFQSLSDYVTTSLNDNYSTLLATTNMDTIMATDPPAIPSSLIEIFNSLYGMEIIGKKDRTAFRRGSMVRRSEARCLAPNNWLTGTVIEHVLAILCDCSQQYNYVTPDLYPALANTDSSTNSNLINVHRWFTSGQLDANILLIPININRSHWALAILDQNVNQITYYDPLPTTTDKANQHLQLILKWWEDINSYLKKSIDERWVLKIEDNGDRQTHLDSTNCGVYILLHARKLIMSAHLTKQSFSNLHMAHIRVNILMMIIEQDKHYDITRIPNLEEISASLNRTSSANSVTGPLNKDHIFPSKLLRMMKIANRYRFVLFTDGSCLLNNKDKNKAPTKDICGYGIVVLWTTISDIVIDHSTIPLLATIKGPVSLNSLHPDFIGAEELTNNTAELSAIGMGLRFLLEYELLSTNCEIEICFDSKYAHSVLSRIHSPNTNISLIEQIRLIYDTCCNRLSLGEECIIWTHVKGHSGNQYNTLADSLAKEGCSLPGKLTLPNTSEILRAKNAVLATARNSTTSYANGSHSLVSLIDAPVLLPVTTYTIPPSIVSTSTAEDSELQFPPQPFHMVVDAQSDCNLSQDFIDTLQRRAQDRFGKPN